MISELLLSELDAEMKNTRAMLERVPMKADFKPHAKSMPLGKLAPHVAELAGFGVTILTTPELDFGKSTTARLPFESPEQLVKAFEEGAAKVRAALKNTPDAAWNENWKLSFQGQADFQRIALSCLSRDVSESPGASSGAAGRLSAPERQAASGDLRPLGG